MWDLQMPTAASRVREERSTSFTDAHAEAVLQVQQEPEELFWMRNECHSFESADQKDLPSPPLVEMTDAEAGLQVQRELEEERRLAEEQQRHAQEAIQAKVAELKAIEAARRQEVRTQLSCTRAHPPGSMSVSHSDAPEEIYCRSSD